MKRIETIEDVKKAMDLNEYFYNYVWIMVENDTDYFKEENRNDRKNYLKDAKQKLAEILDESDDLADLHLRLQSVAKWVDDALCDTNWIPSFEDSIDCALGSRDDFNNIIIDNDKVYRLFECYAEKDDKTFIIREEFYPTYDEFLEYFDEGRQSIDDWELPKQECVGWYAGSPESDATDKFYGKL